MKISEELIAIKMCIRTLSAKVKRLENVNKQLKKKLYEINAGVKVETISDKNAELINKIRFENRIQNLLTEKNGMLQK